MYLCDDLLYIIFKFLPNEDIFNLTTTSKYYNNILTDDYFFNYVKYRKHPMVFNYADNICNICNIGIYILTGENFKFIRCKHCN